MDDSTELGREIAVIVKDYVARELRPFEDRIARLEARVAQLEAEMGRPSTDDINQQMSSGVRH